MFWRMSAVSTSACAEVAYVRFSGVRVRRNTIFFPNERFRREISCYACQ